MGGVALGLGGLVALIALLLRKGSEKKALPPIIPPTTGKALTENSPKPYAVGLPENVKKVIIKHGKGGPTTRTELEIAASSATMAGYRMLGEELLRKAQVAPKAARTSPLNSPFSEISHDAWTKFATFMRADPEKQKTGYARGRYGMFQMGTRRLVDFGLMANPRKKPDGTWTADWTINVKKFLADPKLQYKLFTRSMENFRNLILERYRNAIGTKLDGQPASLSGLLAVAHFAGIDGLGKWLSNPELRERFKATSEAYMKANGIF